MNTDRDRVSALVPSCSSTSAPRSTIASIRLVKTHMPFCRSPSVSICLATLSKVGSGQKRTVTSTRGPMMKPIEVSCASLSSSSRTEGELR